MADDFPSDITTTGVVAVNGSATGNIEVSGDHDWFRVNLIGGRNYLIDLRGAPSGGGTLGNPELAVFDSVGNSTGVGDTESGLGHDAQLALHVNASGTYFLDATGLFTGLDTGTYTVEVRDIGTSTLHFQIPHLALAAFGASPTAGGWTSQNLYPRVTGFHSTSLIHSGNVGHDKMIVGFGADGAYVSFDAPHDQFTTPFLGISAFAASPASGGWTSQDEYPRTIAEVNNSGGLGDIVGFGSAGVYVALGTFDGHFVSPFLGIAAFGADPAAGGWTSQNLYPRLVADVNGFGGLADIVGFGAAGTYISINDGTGHFGSVFLGTNAFGSDPAAGGWSTQDAYPRFVADVNGDSLPDIVGFGSAGVYVALGSGNGHFGQPIFALAGFGADVAGGGWTSQNLYPRQVSDVNYDGRADIVGFGASGVYYALGQANGTFGPVVTDNAGFGSDPAHGGWTSNDLFPRMLEDVSGDSSSNTLTHRADIVGFGNDGVYVAQSLDFHLL